MTTVLDGMLLDQGSDVIQTDSSVPVTITGNITDNSGKLVSSGFIEFELQPDSQSLPYSVLPNLVVANPARGYITAGGQVVQQPGGVAPLLIWPNNLILPANSLYQVTIAPYGIVSRVYNGVLISSAVNPQSLASLTFVNPQNVVVGPIIDANPLVTMSMVPVTDSTFIVGDPLHYYSAGYFRTLHVDNLIAGNVSGPLEVSSDFILGQPAPGQPILSHTFASTVVFPPNLVNPNSYFTVDDLPLVTTTFTIFVDAGLDVGTVIIDPTGLVTFFSPGFTVGPGERMEVLAPDPMDVRLTNPALTLVGTRML
jgi:hypothetical protein